MTSTADCKERAAAVCPFGYEVAAARRKTSVMPVVRTYKPVPSFSFLPVIERDMLVRCEGDPSASDWSD